MHAGLDDDHAVDVGHVTQFGWVFVQVERDGAWQIVDQDFDILAVDGDCQGTQGGDVVACCIDFTRDVEHQGGGGVAASGNDQVVGLGLRGQTQALAVGHGQGVDVFNDIVCAQVDVATQGQGDGASGDAGGHECTAVDVGLLQVDDVDGVVGGATDTFDGACTLQLLVLRSSQGEGTACGHDDAVHTGEVGGRIERDGTRRQCDADQIDAAGDGGGIERGSAEADQVQGCTAHCATVDQVGCAECGELCLREGERCALCDGDFAHGGQHVVGQVDSAFNGQSDVARAGEGQCIGGIHRCSGNRHAERASAVVDDGGAVNVGIEGVDAAQGDIGGAGHGQDCHSVFDVVGCDVIAANVGREHHVTFDDQVLAGVDDNVQDVVVGTRNVASDDVGRCTGQQVCCGAGGVDGQRLQVRTDQVVFTWVLGSVVVQIVELVACVDREVTADFDAAIQVDGQGAEFNVDQGRVEVQVVEDRASCVDVDHLVDDTHEAFAVVDLLDDSAWQTFKDVVDVVVAGTARQGVGEHQCRDVEARRVDGLC